MTTTTNFKIKIEYDGTLFSGWQIQKNKKTVQGEIEKTLSHILNQKIKINGSGRTDAGVHALGQVANFHANTLINYFDLKKGFNSIIKYPIVIRELYKVDFDFHARYHAVSKEYHYNILNRIDPPAISKNYFWHIKNKLDLKKMNQCCNLIQGNHDFKSFEASGSPKSSTIRKIFFVKIEQKDKDKLVFKIKGNGFLRFMVRNIVGTIILVGKSKINSNDFEKIFKAKNRNLAGPTAPPHGLFLVQVNYS
ncbi:MAG: tRNA pseudouridine(38-40) synthase TruA [Desulfobacteraceae bacterium 4572_130]|nr:MAG: tRNA pseudouridine(38-40) synthase TruA [Desulfobacteraceae bacterium 4572_130]